MSIFDRTPNPIGSIPCPDCPQKPGCNFDSPNPERPEPCPTCAGYGTILHPEEVAYTKRQFQKMRDQADYDLQRRMVQWDEYIEGRWSA